MFVSKTWTVESLSKFTWSMTVCTAFLNPCVSPIICEKTFLVYEFDYLFNTIKLKGFLLIRKVNLKQDSKFVSIKYFIF